MGGVYGFMTAERCQREIDEYQRYIIDVREYMKRGHLLSSPFEWHGPTETSTFVIGTVKLWGDVVEHETGYRAEYGKLTSIDEMFGPGDLHELRGRYDV